MKITRKDVISINQLYDKGVIINEGSLDFALTSIKKYQDWLEQLAYLLRALLIDHIFQDGNKRTATALLLTQLERHNCLIEEQAIITLILKLIKDNVIDIKQIKHHIALLVY